MPIGSVSWLAEGMLGGSPARISEQSGWEFDVRNQLFHGSKPLGWIRKWTVCVNDREVKAEKLYVVLRGQRLRAAELPSVSEIWWHPGELLTIQLDEAVPSAFPVDVSVELRLSTFFFTPEIDRYDIYPSIPLQLTAILDLEVEQ